ncbi:helicase domino-like isoform X2 [Mizuhopecten yessoensis]|uniref:E1A-binding protein p400 n=1 Tax=Mizuhopecten yessoensis TaxID=6573 RepID=A0A210QD71_MIZYE|nr:helicase domino-like isoform X2 [Mizuhopecten yessoensis]OWF46679.1 E1A-binding protein p400 [Mizuhopecten yessoensis]
MQRNDANDVKQRRGSGSRDQSGQSPQQESVQHYVLTGQLQAITGTGRQTTLGLLPSGSPGVSLGSSNVATPVVGSSTPLQHQTVVVSSQDLERIFTGGAPGTTTNATTPGLSAQALQRQLSTQGIVGVISPGVSRPVTGPFPGGATTALIRQAGATPSGPELQVPPTLTLVTATTPSGAPGVGTLSASGATVHHHGLSPSRGAPPTPRANLQQPSLNMSIQPTGQQQTPKTIVAAGVAAPTSVTNLVVGKVLQETKPSITPLGLTHTFPNLTALANQSAMGPSPKKKVKVEEKAPATAEIANNRKLILDQKHREMIEIKENYIEYLTELFFLQNSGNMMDYHTWKKRPTPQLVHFLKSGNLDSDEEDDHGQERKINNEVKVITCSGSNVPLATPVAISTTLPPSVAALNQQAPSQRTAASTTTNSTTTLTTSTVATVSMPQLQSQMSKAADTKPLVVHTTLATKTTHTTPILSQPSTMMRMPKSPPTSPGETVRLHTRQHTISNIYDGSIGSQEAIVERAKQEAQVMQRVAELRKEGLWSSRRLPKVQEPPRNKSHWDYLLEEMQWLAADFQQERKWKKAAARKVAKMVSKYFQDLEQKEIRAEKEEAQKLKRIAGQIAKQVREFWTNVEKVVQYKQQTRNEEKRKKALDLHLNFIVDQTEKYSTWLTEGLKKDSKAGSSVGGSCVTTPEHSSDGGDDEFEPEADESDDEETIEKAEADMDETSTQAELDALQKEGEVPLEELLKSLPQEVLSGTASLTQDTEVEADDEHDKQEKDDEFAASEEEEVDVEETIEEQEKLDKKVDYSKELADLQNEGDMNMDELYKKYAGAYDSDFELPESESGTEDDSDDEDEEDSEEEEEESEEEGEEDNEENADNKEDEVGLDFLMTSDTTSQDTQAQGDAEEKGPGKELVDIAAEAQSLQPKGYTLQTTEVKTKVPFLIKHTLREYQHVGLDWLATMYEKRLNGILADEMGLGKTIQTIALLAHLACDKGIWGPHLIVVPTSVMLNWEMEIKKWCPAFKILTYYGNQKERKLKRQGWTKTNAFHVCITSYKLVIQDHQSFRRKKWKYFILDEAQNIKNFKSQRWQTLLNFSSQRRLLLTGTPLQNNLMELWSLMHFLMPNVFQSHREFKEWFANPLTGMIEGSHEYNESLIKRLHKVLRPFLLRRLKADVEKQMPKKYEHVVMCQLSKRQRFLYDDFMSQGKTKETLASGHFMSVINILMQLRKVCNHPSLFDERPIVSPFQTGGITFNTSSSVLAMLEYDPFKDVDLLRYPGLADMEQDLPAFVAHRVKRLQTSRQLIEEIDEQPDPAPRLKPGKLKPVNFRSISPLSRSVSPLTNQTPATTCTDKTKAVTSVTTTTATSTALAGTTISSTPVTTLTAAVTPRTQTSVTMTTSSVTQPLSAVATSVAGCSASVTSTLSAVLTSSGVATPQAKVGPITTATVSLPSSSSQVATSQPITVQIQQTDQGARLMIPAGQLSQLPAGFIQIVQTSMGQQIIASSVATTAQQHVSSPSITAASSASRAITTSSTIVNGLPAITTVAASSASTILTTVTSQVKPAMSIQLPLATTTTTLKPVMKVSPMVTATGSTTNVVKASVSTTISSAEVKPTTGPSTRLASQKSKRRIKTELMLDSVCDKREHRRREKLEYIAHINKLHCERKPVYGQDLRCTVNVMSDTDKTCVCDNTWAALGHVHCTNIHSWSNPYRPEVFWKQTKVLSNLVHTPLQYLHELEDILSRYVFVTPPVVSPCIKMHVSHPPPSSAMKERWRDFFLHKDVSPKASCLHKISSNRMVQFPELRLIQYDCGKLQTLDLLLRRLKSGDHRILIFTQMTKMLNILESFLSYHGHRYLRLDGTTRVEQRQFLMDRFNADKRIFCFILSTRSGGIGVNLTGADTVIFYDSDWNPTMDAQAQDRCHRIGQTRDVHIYRLISKKTVEENILKKANQKRMLGDMAIEGGNFTTAFFKENTIQELFSEPTGLDSLVEPKVTEVKMTTKSLGGGDELKEIKTPVDGNKQTVAPSDKNIVAQFEQALGKAEDETDVVAANLVKAEQKAELAEFDENIPWDEREAEKRKEEEEMSKAEQELAMLDKELSPIERFAVTFMENEMKPDDNLEISVEEIANSKKDWELARLKALKEDEERRLELEEDEMLYTYLRDDSYNQIFISDTDQEHMPMWAPPTPPHDDNDIYLDQTMCFLYEPTVMPESQLPPIYIKKEHKKPKVESITTRKQKQRKEEQPRVPRSLFDRPTAALLRMRREAKLKQGGLLKPFRPVPPVLNKPADQSSDHPEWLIHEDWALLQAVQSLFDVPLNLMVVSPAHQLNWDLVADIVSSVSRVYRSAKQCRNRYENVIIPREEGRILYDINPRKQSKKTKGIYKTKNNRPMRTSQLYVQDGNQAITMLHSLRFDSAKTLAAKRPPTLKQTLVSPTPKNPKHAAVLSESGITYDQPLDPMNVAEIRAQRIQREKKQNQAAAAATAEQQHLAARTVAQQQAAAPQATPAPQASAQPQPVTVTAAIAIPQGAVPQGVVTQHLQPIQTTVASVMAATAVPKSGVPQGATTVSLARSAVGATGNIVVNTPSGVAANFAAINRRMSQATSLGQASTVTVTGTLNPAIRAQRPLTIPIQDITSITSQTGQVTHVATTGQVARTQIQTTVPTLTSTQLARIASTQGTTLPTGTVQATMTKALTQQQLIALTRQQRQTTFQQQPRKLNLTPDQINQQRLKQLQQGRGVGAQKVIAQQLVTSLAQVPKQKIGTSLARQIPQELLLHQQKLPQKTQVQVVAQGQAGTQLQQIHMATTQGGGIPTTQIIQAQVHQVGQPATLTTAVKTSAAGTPIQITQLPQQKAGVAKATTINQLQSSQLKHMQLINPPKRPLQQPSKITSLGQVGKPLPLNAVQIIQQPSTGQNVTYQLQQLVKRNPGSGMIITSQPTIIATVTQGQQGQLVHKVLSTSSTQSSHLQTITAASHPVAHATIVTGTPQMSVATLSLATASSQATKPTVVSTLSADPRQAVQVHSVAPQQAKIATISQAAATSQTIQQIQVTPATLQQVHTTVAAPAIQQPLTVTVAPSSQSPALTATILQTIPAPVQQEAPSAPQTATQIQVTTIPQSTANVPPQQTLLPVGAVTAQAAAAAVQALPQGTAQGLVSVAQSPQQQAAAAKGPYAMRTRNPPKH